MDVCVLRNPHHAERVRSNWERGPAGNCQRQPGAGGVGVFMRPARFEIGPLADLR